MKTLKHSTEFPKKENETLKKIALRSLFSGLLVAGAMGLGNGCGVHCPVDSECKTKNIEFTVKVGEKKEATTNGEKIIVDVLDIDQEVDLEGLRCRAYAGWAKVRVRIESNPPYDKTFSIAPNMCISIYEKCVVISNVRIEQDVEMVPDIGGDGGAGEGGVAEGGISDGGGSSDIGDGGKGDTENALPCRISNERLSFTLTVGE